MSDSKPKETNEEKTKETKEKTKEDAEKLVPEEMDAGSESFNPLSVLYAKEYRISKKPPPVEYQNIAAYETAMKNVGIWGMQQKASKPSNDTASSSRAATKKSTAVAENQSTRRFLPHQMPIKAPSNFRNRHSKNIWKSIEKLEGPLGTLSNCMKTGCKIRVILRNEHGIRGQVEGKLISFDKHWNLLLNEVIEVWRRRKFKYGVNKTCAIENEAQDCTQLLANLGISLPQQTVKSLNRKNVEITRQLQQLLVRGEQVVLVSIVKTVE